MIAIIRAAFYTHVAGFAASRWITPLAHLRFISIVRQLLRRATACFASRKRARLVTRCKFASLSRNELSPDVISRKGVFLKTRNYCSIITIIMMGFFNRRVTRRESNNGRKRCNLNGMNEKNMQRLIIKRKIIFRAVLEILKHNYPLVVT
jgi:hypothetical protein